MALFSHMLSIILGNTNGVANKSVHVTDMSVSDFVHVLEDVNNMVGDTLGPVSAKLVLFQDVFNMSVDFLDVSVVSVLQVVPHVSHDLVLLGLGEVFNLELMLDHVHNLGFQQGEVFRGSSFVDNMDSSVLNFADMNDMLNPVVGNDSDVSSSDMVLLEDPHDVLVDLASLEVLGLLHVRVEVVENGNKFTAVDDFSQVTVDLLDDRVSQVASDASLDALLGPFLGIGDLGFERLP